MFRICYDRFRECVSKGSQPSTVSFEFNQGNGGRRMFGRKQEEFAADFCLVSRRLLTEFEYRIFRYYFLLGAGSKLCSENFGLDRGHFYHVLYTIEHKLGRGFAELEPYALWPLDEYFGGTVRKGPAFTVEVRPVRRRRRKAVPESLPLSA